LKLFQLKHLEPNEIKDKIRPLLSEKATIEVADRSNQLIVTDYTENIRLLTEFIEALDVPSPSDTVIEFYPLKHSEAEELGNLLTLILNAQSPPPGGSSSSSSGPSAQAGNQVKIWPDKTANRLIVAAPKSKQPEIQKLVEVLDTEKPQDVAPRVIPLKNVTAEDLVKEIAPLYQKMSGRSLKDVIEIAANN